MIRFLEKTRSLLLKKIVPLKSGAKLMVLLGGAFAMAQRRDPCPSSLRFVTSLGSGGRRRKNRIATPAVETSRRKITIILATNCTFPWACYAAPTPQHLR